MIAASVVAVSACGFAPSPLDSADGGPDADSNAPDAGAPVRCGTPGTLRDSFSDGELSPAWIVLAPERVVLDNEGLKLSSTIDRSPFLISEQYVDFRESETTISVPSPPTGARVSTSLISASGPSFGIAVGEGTFYAFTVDGEAAFTAQFPFDPARESELRLHNRADVLVLSSRQSADSAWIEHAEIPAVGSLESVRAQVSLQGPDDATAVVTGYNNAVEAVAACPSSSLAPFVGTSAPLNWSLGSNAGNPPSCTASIDFDQGVAQFNHIAASSGCLIGLRTRHVFDFTDGREISAAFSQLGPNPESAVGFFELTALGRRRGPEPFYSITVNDAQGICGVTSESTASVCIPIGANERLIIRRVGDQIIMRAASPGGEVDVMSVLVAGDQPLAVDLGSFSENPQGMGDATHAVTFSSFVSN